MFKKLLIKLLNKKFLIQYSGRIFYEDAYHCISLPNGLVLDLTQSYMDTKNIHSIVRSKDGYYVVRSKFGRLSKDEFPLREPEKVDLSEDNSVGEWVSAGAATSKELSDEQMEWLGLK